MTGIDFAEAELRVLAAPVTKGMLQRELQSVCDAIVCKANEARTLGLQGDMEAAHEAMDMALRLQVRKRALRAALITVNTTKDDVPW
jgi:uncharacterized protein YerC